MQYINPALLPEYDPEKTFLGQLLGFRQKEGQANLAQNQAGYYDALRQLEGAKIPYAQQTAEAKMQHEMLKNFWKEQQGLKEQAHALNLPGDYASKRSLRGAQAGASNAAAALSHTRRAGQEGTNSWMESLRSNPLFQAKTVGGRLSPEVVAAISGQAAIGNSPLQMDAVDRQGMPVGQPQQPAQMPMPQGGARGAPMQGGIPFARSPQGENAPAAQNFAPQEQINQAAQQQKTMYQKAYPQLMDAIQNKLEKAQLANPAAAQKLQYLTNIKETIAGINPDVVKAYGGIDGRAKLRRDKGLSALGIAPPEYDEYVEFVENQAVILASQIRQFYGDSIQPKKEEQIMETFSSENIYKNPEAALRKMAELIRIVESEGMTYAKPVGSLIHEANNLGFGKKWDGILSKHKEEKERKQNGVNETVKPLSSEELKEAKQLQALGKI